MRPEVTLGEYKGVAVTRIDASVTEEELNQEIERERKSNARTITVEDRAVEDGDTAVIDFEGFMDGVAFEGGKGENHSLVIGSHSFIEGFEEQLIGKNAGDELDVNVTFPEEYHAQELAGKPAVFKVKINEIKTEELPDLDDEFAQDVSEFDTLAEYKESVEKKLMERKEAEGKRAQENEAIDKIVEASQMEIPDVMIESQVQSMLEDFANRISQQGLSMEQYMQFSGATTEQMQEQMRPEALKRIQSTLVLEEIAKKEDIQVSEEDIDNELDRMAGMYGMQADQLKEYMGDSEKESMKMEISIQKAVELIMECATEIDADPE